MLMAKNNPYKHKLALEQMMRDAAAETERLQLSLDVKPTAAEAREQLSAEIRARRKAELELKSVRTVARVQPLPSEIMERDEQKTLLAQARAYVEHHGYVVIPFSLLEAHGLLVKRNAG
jgi:hypothetical protein